MNWRVTWTDAAGRKRVRDFVMAAAANELAANLWGKGLRPVVRRLR